MCWWCLVWAPWVLNKIMNVAIKVLDWNIKREGKEFAIIFASIGHMMDKTLNSMSKWQKASGREIIWKFHVTLQSTEYSESKCMAEISLCPDPFLSFDPLSWFGMSLLTTFSTLFRWWLQSGATSQSLILNCLSFNHVPWFPKVKKQHGCFSLEKIFLQAHLIQSKRNSFTNNWIAYHQLLDSMIQENQC